MSKKENRELATSDKTAPVVSTGLDTLKGSALSSPAGASPELMERMLEVQDNLESVENFTLPTIKMTSSGFQIMEGQLALTELIGTIIYTKKMNVFYARPYNKNEITAPDCYSLDGVMPVTGLRDSDGKPTVPVNPTCKGCPMAEFGTNQMKSGKACRNVKPMYLLLADEAIMPRVLTITPANLKAANQYLVGLMERSLSYTKVKTKITAYKKDADDTYMSLRFEMGSKIDEQKARDVLFLKNKWLPVMDSQLFEQREFDGVGVEKVSNSDVGF